jgi:hypothetical protein
MSEETYGLIVSFPDQSDSFVHGFEAGMIWEMMKAPVTHFSMTVHTANEEVIRRQASAADKDVMFERVGYEGWSKMTLIDRLPKTIRARAKFKVIQGGLTEQAAKGDK